MKEAVLHSFLANIISVLIPNTIYFAFSMSGFVFGVNFVFSFLEDIGYIARVAYVFDGLMSKLGVQGKSICPMIMGFGCTIGGAAGARVISKVFGRKLSPAETRTGLIMELPPYHKPHWKHILSFYEEKEQSI